MQVAQSKVLCINDDDGIDVGHINPRLDDGGGNQQILLMIHKVCNHALQFFRIHLTMAHSNAYAGDLPLYQCLQLINILNTVVHDKDLSVAAYLKVYRIADDLHIKGMYLRLHRITVRGRGANSREIPRPHQRELQCTRDGSCRHGERIHVYLQLFQLFLHGDTEFLLLVDDEQSQIFELHILAHQSVCSDQDINFTLFQAVENLLLFF